MIAAMQEALLILPAIQAIDSTAYREECEVEQICKIMLSVVTYWRLRRDH